MEGVGGSEVVFVLICIIEYVIRLWKYVFMLFILNCPWSLRLCWTHNLD